MNRRQFLSSSAAAVALPAANSVAAVVPEAPALPIAKNPPRVVDFKRADAAPGTLPPKWICGSPSAMDNTDPPIQVHWYNEHTVIMRQNKAYTYEAPFMLLFFGNEKILMVDQGFVTLRDDMPLRDVVDSTIDQWCAKHGRNSHDLELLLAITHLHTDHYAGQNQFADRPNTRYMGLTHAECVGFWGMTDYPEQRVTLDLGGREIWVWGSPGHTFTEFAHYDTYTQILFSGDMFYRGRCYVSMWEPWVASMKRLVEFCDRHPVAFLGGCHVEMGRDGEDYPAGCPYQPNEAPWHLSVAELRHAYEVAQTVQGPGSYFTGALYIVNRSGPVKSAETNEYAYR